jgi:conserved oligomeric Golgi complex subunit 8
MSLLVLLLKIMSAVKGEEARVQAELVNAAVAHNGVFSSCIDLNRVNASRWQQSAKDAADLSTTLDDLHKTTTELVQEGQVWRQARSIATAAVSNHQKMVEILEIPQTLDVCLRAEMFHEALLILDFSKNLLSLRGSRDSLSLLDQLEENVGKTLHAALLTVVVPRLSQHLPLNTAVKLVSFLRRLHTDDEVLTKLFLDCKTSFLDQCLQEASTLSHTPYAFLSKLLNVYKVHVAEAVHQFKACFSAAALPRLAAWCNERADAFLAAFDGRLQLVTNGAEIASLTDQTANVCAASVKVGTDIGPLLMERICHRAFQLFAAQIQGATAAFRAAMQSISWKLPSGGSLTHSKAEDPPSTAAPPPAPIVLLQFLPLAYAMNGILSAFNEIRRCAASSIAWPCFEELGSFLRVIISDVRRAHMASLLMEPSEQESLRRFRKALTEELLPHVWLCARRVFPSKEVLLSELERALEVEVCQLRDAPPQASRTTHTLSTSEVPPTSVPAE